jgi:hypothetical protein
MGRLGFTGVDEPIQTTVGMSFHRLHNFPAGYV